MPRRNLTLWLVVLGVMTPVPLLFAHAPVYPDRPPTSPATAAPIKDHTVSRVYYSESSPQAPETWFVFDAEAGDTITMSLGVPYIERLSSFEPLLAIAGPGLDVINIRRVELGDLIDPAGIQREQLPRALPSDCDVLVFQAYGEKRVFHEHVTGTTSWILVEAQVTAAQSGRYYLAAYQLQGDEREGKLFLTIGTKERFPLRDVFGIFRIRRFVREFHELR